MGLMVAGDFATIQMQNIHLRSRFVSQLEARTSTANQHRLQPMTSRPTDATLVFLVE